MKIRLKKVLALTSSLTIYAGMFLNLHEGTLCSSISAMAIENAVEINATNFPDKKFRDYIDENFDTTDDDILTPDEIAVVTSIKVGYVGIYDLTGVEYFTALEKLDCFQNNLKSLDISNNTALTSLNCNFNELTSLDVSKNTALTHLHCEYNELTNLDIRNNTALTYLVCSANLLTTLDLSNNTLLRYISCSKNQLTNLDISQNTKLYDILCSENQLTTIDTSNNPELAYLYCHKNQITNLELSNNPALYHLCCHHNNLTNLDLKNNLELTWLCCQYNNLTSLDLNSNLSLKNYEGYGNIYNINLIGDSFDITKLPEGFEFDKTSKWNNANLNGNILTVSDPTKYVDYVYDLGNGESERFNLKPVSCEIINDMVSPIEPQLYTGKPIYPSIKIVCGNYILKENIDYTVTFKNNTNVGTATYIIKGIGKFYKGSCSGEWKIEKGRHPSSLNIPTVAATYGNTLADIELPYGFTWQDAITTPVGNVGNNTFTATYTPYDTERYEITKDIEIVISVNKAIPIIQPVFTITEYVEGNALPKINFKGNIKGAIHWTTELTNGLAAGENTLVWQFTPEDTDNYEIVTGTEIVVAQTTTTTTSTTTQPVTTTSSTSTSEDISTTTITTSTSTEITITTATETTTLPEITTSTDTTSNEVESTISTSVTSQNNTSETTTTAVTTTLPQTGYSDIYSIIIYGAGILTLLGVATLVLSKRKEN